MGQCAGKRKKAKSQRDAKENEKEVVVPEAVPLIEQTPSAMHKLDKDGWNGVFDWLSMVDVHSFGRTCKAFQRVAGEYFQWKFESIALCCKDGLVKMPRGRIVDFIPYVQRIRFDYKLNEPLLSKLSNLKHLELVGITLTEPRIKCFEHILNELETISMERCRCDIDGGVYENLLKQCKKLKSLKIGDEFVIACLPHKYPETLQRLDILSYDKRFGNDELKIFFELNRNVRNFAINSKCISANRQSLMESNIKLDDLTVKYVSAWEFNSILSDLHQRGFYHRLHYYVYDRPLEHQLAEMPGLFTLQVAYDRVTKLPPLSSLNELIFDQIYKEDIKQIPNMCINLERLILCRAFASDISPFIRLSRELKEIKVKHLTGIKSLDVAALNSERKKLNGAQKLIIYVSEDVYLATKWSTRRCSRNLIEIQRIESHKLQQTHNLLPSHFFV